MRILIIGIQGMLGYNLYKYLTSNRYNIFGTIRNNKKMDDYNIFSLEHTENNLIDLFQKVNPTIIINCIAKLKETSLIQKNEMIYSNCTLPIFVADYCNKNNIYFIHFSSDAVFKSSDNYNSIKDNYSPESFYGLTKCISESISKTALVLRICPIGYDKYGNKSLFNFIYNNKSKDLNGYTNCIFNGITIDVIANQIIKIIESNNKLYGIHHITGPKISKYDLLQVINKKFNLNKNIIPIDMPNICRLLEDDLVDTSKLNWKSLNYI
tara:strand:+ start:199 stop:999 length:801 start_codon:yes stop_codon:yes gene_type:complete